MARQPIQRNPNAPVLEAEARRTNVVILIVIVASAVLILLAAASRDALKDFGVLVIAALAVFVSLLVSLWTFQVQRLHAESQRLSDGRRDAYRHLLDEMSSGDLSRSTSVELTAFASEAVIEAVNRWHGILAGWRGSTDPRHSPEGLHWQRVAERVVEEDLRAGDEAAMEVWKVLKDSSVPDPADTHKMVSPLAWAKYLDGLLAEQRPKS